MTSILSLDIARTTGWAFGRIGDRPKFGTQRLTPPGASHAEIFGAMIGWLVPTLQVFQPDVLVYEAPFPPQQMGGKTNFSTTRVLLGLPAIVEGVAYRVGGMQIREAAVGDVRASFIGTRRLKRDLAKKAVMAKCRELGFAVADDNAADAVALWFHAASLLCPDNFIPMPWPEEAAE